ncbi:DASH complex subunit Hsk3 like-domain-containing protein [Aspergillus spectabilis]
MPPSNYQHHYSTSASFPRPSTLPSHSTSSFNSHNSSASNTSSASMSAAKTRQYAHLHSQLAQLNAHLADTENLLRMTAVQAEDMRFLGGYVGGLFMGAAKVLGEEGVKAHAQKGGQMDEGKGKEGDLSVEGEDEGER